MEPLFIGVKNKHRRIRGKVRVALSHVKISVNVGLESVRYEFGRTRFREISISEVRYPLF